MRKVIRPTYPAGFSIGLVALIFVIAFLLSHQIFDVSIYDIKDNPKLILAMVLVSSATIIMILIIWEEIMFPINVKEVKGGRVFRNHGTKLKTQLLIYCSIPAIFTFVFLEFEVNHLRFFIWASICIVAPILEKIASGLNNYNDFLMLTDEIIEYKDNEKEGLFKVNDIQSITIIHDESHIINKLQLTFKNNDSVTIDLDKMELDSFYEAIYVFVTSHYKHLLKESKTEVTA